MNSKRVLHIIAAISVAGFLTAVAMRWDWMRTNEVLKTSGLQWTRQVASQTEALILEAREAGEKDPVAWAAGRLSQGIEPRMMRVTRIVTSEVTSESPEKFHLDRLSGTFEYVKRISTNSDLGVQILVNVGWVGFLGSKSPLTSDLLSLAVFGVCFVFFFFLLGRFFGFDDMAGARKRIAAWLRMAQPHLIRLGVQVRELVRQAQRLAVNTGKSRQILTTLRSNIHRGLTEIHASNKKFAEGEAAAARAEGLALNAAIEANRIGGDARRIADMVSEIHVCIGAMREAARKNQLLLAQIEKRIEPWATDADMAFHAFDDVKDATDSLSVYIRGTTEALVGQAKLLQRLDAEFHSEAEQAVETKKAPPSQEPQVTASRKFPDPLPPLKDKKTA